MYHLLSTADKLQLITDTAGDVEVHISYTDKDGTTITPGRTSLVSISTETTTDLLTGPATGVRGVKSISIANNHASVVSSPILRYNDGTATNTLHRCALNPGETAVYTDSAGWAKLNAAGVPVLGNSNPQPDIQTFTAGGTWTKPTSFVPKVVIVEMIGAGGGGGAGASLATAVVAKGGGGGGGGAWVRGVFAASDLPSTVAVGIGTGGTAGVRGAAGAAGGAGGVGGNTTFGSYLTAYGGGGGAGGAISAAVTGGGGGGGAGGAGGTGSTSGGTGGLPTAASNGAGGQGVTGQKPHPERWIHNLCGEFVNLRSPWMGTLLKGGLMVTPTFQMLGQTGS